MDLKISRRQSRRRNAKKHKLARSRRSIGALAAALLLVPTALVTLPAMAGPQGGDGSEGAPAEVFLLNETQALEEDELLDEAPVQLTSESEAPATEPLEVAPNPPAPAPEPPAVQPPAAEEPVAPVNDEPEPESEELAAGESPEGEGSGSEPEIQHEEPVDIDEGVEPDDASSLEIVTEHSGEEAIVPQTEGESRPQMGLTSLSYAPSCAAGWVYGVSDTGQIRQVAQDGTVTNFGTPAGVSSFNGLGIGSNGTTVYGYERTNSAQTARLYEFDTTAGTWSSLNKSQTSTGLTSPERIQTSPQFVAGGVDLSSGKYYFGGFGVYRVGNTNYRFFAIWEYNPSNGAVTYKGWVDAGGSGGSANGDLAFDQNGNLFIVRGSGSTTQVISVTAQNLSAAIGGRINSSGSREVSNTTSDVNGVAFDSAGKAYLGSSSMVQSYNMPNWSGKTDVVSSGFGSTDLATCSSPATITIEKILEDGRVNDGDQFTLTLHQGDTELATATTEGTATGVQENRIGPFPTARNVTLTFAEVAAGTTDMSTYASSFRCFVDGTLDPTSSGDGTSGNITIPAGAEAVRCEFANVPLVADVTVHKRMADINGENSVPQPEWEVTAGLDSISGTASIGPTGSQHTGISGSADWRVTFGSKDDSATLRISEEDRDGYELVSSACVVTHLNGSTTEVTLDDIEGDVGGVSPGDNVECTFVNQPTPASVKVDKTWKIVDHNGELLDGYDSSDIGAWPDWLEASLSLTGPGTAGASPQEWGVPRAGYFQGESVTISEDASVNLGSCELTSSTIAPAGDTDGELPFEATLAAGENAYEITNTVTCEQKLTLIKELGDPFAGTLFPTDWAIDDVSAWELVATGGSDGSLTYASGDTKTVDYNTPYTLTESDVAGYVLAGLACDTDGALDGDKVTVGLGQTVTCIFTNDIKPGTVTWSKVGGGNDAPLLAGSEWTLTVTPADGGPEVTETITDCVADDSAECSGFDKNPAVGIFQLEGLAWGDYVLVESRAPAGYVVDETPREFSISAAGLVFEFEDGFVNVQREGPVLPLTGGIGRDHVYVAGVVVALVGMAAYYLVSRRRIA